MAITSETRETAIAANAPAKPTSRGRFSCVALSELGGEIRVSARALDSAGRAATTQHSFWVAGRDEWVFDQANHDRIDLIPEKKRYEPGETARFQVRMPYRKATALITVERDGVLEARVVKLSGQSPTVISRIVPAGRRMCSSRRWWCAVATIRDQARPR
jgi:alpha-2-macroglobulin